MKSLKEIPEELSINMVQSKLPTRAKELDKLICSNNLKVRYESEATSGYDVTGTPFSLILHEKQWVIVLGKNRIGQTHTNVKEAYEEATTLTWEQIMCAIMIIAEDRVKEILKKELNKTEL